MACPDYQFLNRYISQNIVTFAPLTIHWPHSSMDRISDSGSEDLGSNPDGVTFTHDI